jgi:hypothetical protein
VTLSLGLSPPDKGVGIISMLDFSRAACDDDGEGTGIGILDEAEGDLVAAASEIVGDSVNDFGSMFLLRGSGLRWCLAAW